MLVTINIIVFNEIVQSSPDVILAVSCQNKNKYKTRYIEKKYPLCAW